MFASPAHAQAAGAAAPGGAAGFILQMAPLLLIFVIFYILMIRPQQARAKAHRAMLASVKKGDTVVTAGGLIGKATRVDEHELEVEIAPNVKVKAVRGTIAEVRPLAGAKPAND